jgi:hypothetical protein
MHCAGIGMHCRKFAHNTQMRRAPWYKTALRPGLAPRRHGSPWHRRMHAPLLN